MALWTQRNPIYVFLRYGTGTLEGKKINKKHKLL